MSDQCVARAVYTNFSPVCANAMACVRVCVRVSFSSTSGLGGGRHINRELEGSHEVGAFPTYISSGCGGKGWEGEGGGDGIPFHKKCPQSYM